MSSNLYKKQCLNLIKIAKEAESSSDEEYNQMDLDLEDQTEIVHNKIPKSKDWAQNCLFNYNDKEFRKTLRMDKKIFWALVEKIKYHPIFYSNSNHLQTSVELQLAVTLNRLGTKSTLWTIATLFGFCETTILNFLDRIIIAIQSLKSEYIVWPSGNYKEEVNAKFEQIQGFPMVIGAIDGSHIPLFEAPSKENKDVYMSRKQKYGIHLQGIVDYQGLFISYEIGWPASVHDAKVFSNSEIFKNYKNYFKEENYLLADSAYPLLPWIMTPFKDPQGLQAQQQKIYNTAHSKTRVVIEQAFGRLKARFPFLKEMR
ncbi:12125_t:CDS:1, partial [Dentiscutata heterogama]